MANVAAMAARFGMDEYGKDIQKFKPFELWIEEKADGPKYATVIMY